MNPKFIQSVGRWKYSMRGLLGGSRSRQTCYFCYCSTQLTVCHDGSHSTMPSLPWWMKTSGIVSKANLSSIISTNAANILLHLGSDRYTGFSAVDFSYLKCICFWFLCMCECLLCVPYVSRCLWRPGKNVRAPGTGVIRGCEAPDVGARNWARILLKNRECFSTVEPSLQLCLSCFES